MSPASFANRIKQIRELLRDDKHGEAGENFIIESPRFYNHITGLEVNPGTMKAYIYDYATPMKENYDSSYYYDWFWITKEKQPTCNPIPMSQIEAEELAQSLHDDYMRYYVQEHKLYLAEKSKEKSIKSAKLFKKL